VQKIYKEKGRKFYRHGNKIASGNEEIEAVSPNSVFGFDVYFENLEKEELGLLIFSLGLDDLKLKFGGGKPACLGTAEVFLKKIEIDNKSLFKSFDAKPEYKDIDKLKTECLRSFQTIANNKNVDKIRQILSYKNAISECPIMY